MAWPVLNFWVQEYIFEHPDAARIVHEVFCVDDVLTVTVRKVS